MSNNNGQGGIGYILRKFPALSETFILNEILALEARGARVQIFSLQRPNDPRFHEALSRLKARVAYVPDGSDLQSLFRHSRRAARFYGQRYAKVFSYAVARGRPSLFWRFLQACYVANEARRLRLKHLHAHFATRPTSVALLASELTQIPFSFTAHAMDIYKKKSHTVLAKKIHKAQRVITVSDYNKRYLEQFANGESDKILRLYNGIDLDLFTPGPGVPDSPFTILSVARLVEKKGLETLIESCGALRDRGIAFQCNIVGRGRLRPKLEELIKRWNLRKHVYLLGPHTHHEVLERYKSSHIFVLPCKIAEDGNRDGLPTVIVEALACSLPVVATPVTGIPEVIRDQENGILVPEDDPNALANAIELLISNGKLYEEMRANARRSVMEDFDIARTSERLHHLFEGAGSEDLLPVR